MYFKFLGTVPIKIENSWKISVFSKTRRMEDNGYADESGKIKTFPYIETIIDKTITKMHTV